MTTSTIVNLQQQLRTVQAQQKEILELIEQQRQEFVLATNSLVITLTN